MENFILTIRFDGLLAAKHAMDASDSHNVIEGAKRLLAAHTYYYVTGAVPDRLYPEAQYFHAYHTGLRPGSMIYDFTLALSAAATWQVMYDLYFRDAIQAWREGRLFEMPEFVRREPVLDTVGPVNRPVFDFAEERQRQAQRLADRTTQAMNQITMPLGRHATTMEMAMHGRPLGAWTRRVPRAYSEDEIAHAVKLHRLQLEAGGKRSLR